MHLIVYDPHLFLRLWVRLLQKRALAARAAMNARVDQCITTANEFIRERSRLKEASKAVNRAQRRLRMRVKGVPLTEDYGTDDALSQETPEVDDAQEFLLKKAYRLAALVAHPDKGGSPEAFQALREAYLAKDLQAIQEFYLIQQKPVLEQVAYWRAEPERAQIRWQKFKQTPAYQIATKIARGTDLAMLEAAVLAFLRDREMRLQLQELNFTAHAAANAEGEAEP